MKCFIYSSHCTGRYLTGRLLPQAAVSRLVRNSLIATRTRCVGAQKIGQTDAARNEKKNAKKTTTNKMTWNVGIPVFNSLRPSACVFFQKPSFFAVQQQQRTSERTLTVILLHWRGVVTQHWRVLAVT